MEFTDLAAGLPSLGFAMLIITGLRFVLKADRRERESMAEADVREDAVHTGTTANADANRGSNATLPNTSIDDPDGDPRTPPTNGDT